MEFFIPAMKFVNLVKTFKIYAKRDYAIQHV